MARPRVSLEFGTYNPEQLHTFTGETILGFTDNTDLPTPTITVAILTEANELLGLLIPKAKDGSVLDRAKRDAQAQVVLGYFYKNAEYVQKEGQGNITIMLSSGYKLVSVIKHHYEMVAPVVEKIRNTGTGRILFNFAAQDAVVSQICAETSIDNGATWVPAGHTSAKRTMTVRNLTKGTEYKFRFYALGTGETRSDYSDTVEKMST